MFRHRAAMKAAPPGPPRTPAEQRLEEIQARVTRTERELERLLRERDRLALHLWLEEDRPQTEIAQRLDQVDRKGGGEGISYAAMQKRMHRIRSTTTTLRVDFQTAV